MVALSAGVGALSGVIGAVASASGARLPTGPLIVLAATFFVLVSLFLAPNRGLLAQWQRHQRSRRVLHLDSVLVDLYALMLQHPSGGRAHGLESIRAMSPTRRGVAHSLSALEARGWASRQGDGWVLTAEGVEEARRRSARSPEGETA
jgi:manganese/zinc/iron transport system permease protein